MSWKDGFSARGQLGSAGFWVREAKQEAGRRVQTHEYPLRDKPFNEDLGRATGKMSFDAYCIGPDYHLERDKLLAEVNKPGPRTLRHPYLGNLQVVVTRFSIRESTREGGYVAVTLQCVEEGEQAFPSVKPSTRGKVKVSADETLDSAIDDFANVFSLSDASAAATNFLADVDAVFSDVSGTVGDVSSPLTSLLTSPASLGTSIAGVVTGIRDAVTSPLAALDVVRKLFGAGERPVASNSSPRAPQTTRNQHALNVLVRTAAVTSAATATADLELAPAQQTDTPLTRDRVLSIRDEVLTEVDAIQETTDPVTGAPINDDVYNNLATLRLHVTEDLSTRAGRLPAVRSYTPDASLPSLVIAHQLYGDASRETEIVALNNIAHPGHVTGGEPLEVLSA